MRFCIVLDVESFEGAALPSARDIDNVLSQSTCLEAIEEATNCTVIAWVDDRPEAQRLVDTALAEERPTKEWHCQNCGHEDTEEAFIPTASATPHQCCECGSVEVFPS